MNFKKFVNRDRNIERSQVKNGEWDIIFLQKNKNKKYWWSKLIFERILDRKTESKQNARSEAVFDSIAKIQLVGILRG